jgi:hypothetical protein
MKKPELSPILKEFSQEVIKVEVSNGFVSTTFCGFIIGDRTPDHEALIRSSETFAERVRQRFIETVEKYENEKTA